MIFIMYYNVLVLLLLLLLLLSFGAAVKRLHSCPLPSGFPTTTTTTTTIIIIMLVVTIAIITTTTNNNNNNTDNSNNDNDNNDMGTAVKRLHSCHLPSGCMHVAVSCFKCAHVTTCCSCLRRVAHLFP